MKGTGGALLCARGLRKDYGTGEGLVRALDEVDLEIAWRIGGCDGTERMRQVDVAPPARRFDRPTAGELWLGGRRIHGLSERESARIRRDEVGFVFQSFHLMEELTA